MSAWVVAMILISIASGVLTFALDLLHTRWTKRQAAKIGFGDHRRHDMTELLRVGLALDHLAPGWRERGSESDALHALLDSRRAMVASRSDRDPVVIHELRGAWRWTGGEWTWFGSGSRLREGDVLVSVDGSDARRVDALDLWPMLFSSRNRLAADRIRVRRDGDEIDVLVRLGGAGA